MYNFFSSCNKLLCFVWFAFITSAIITRKHRAKCFISIRLANNWCFHINNPLCPPRLSAENEEADHSQPRLENEREARRSESLRRQRCKSRRKNIHHFREGDAFLTDCLTDQPAACCLCEKFNKVNPPQCYQPLHRTWIKWLGVLFFFCKKM